jgi:isomaltose glucohydrolase
MTDHSLQRAELASGDLVRLCRRSVEVIDGGQAQTGAYLASPNFPVYRYSWFRDGAFIADAMSRVGRAESAERFFEWCARVLVARTELIERHVRMRADDHPVDVSEMLHCRYTVDGDEAPEEWWNFQLDGYGTWLWALGEHSSRRGRSLEPHAAAIDLCVRYLAAFWAEPSYDWWEENMGHQHTSTLAALHAGLDAASSWEILPSGTREKASRAAADIRSAILSRGIHNGRFAKWLDGDGLDASLIACAVPFHVVAPDDPRARATARAIELQLSKGGVYRHPHDSYYGGGEWLLLAALLGWYYAKIDRRDDAMNRLIWIAGQADEEGNLPEQVSDHLLVPDAYDGWRQRWGPIASPLLWSHAMFLTLAAELGVVDGAA